MNKNRSRSIHKSYTSSNKKDRRKVSDFKLSYSKDKIKKKGTVIKQKNKNDIKHKNKYYEENNEDLLFSMRKRYKDIFNNMKESDKIFKEVKKKHKRKKVSNEIIKGAVILKKLGFNESVQRRKRKRIVKVDVEKIIEIQKIFKGYFIRDVKFKVDRLKLRQCLIELFCLLLHGNWYKAELRSYFLMLKEGYNLSKMNAGNELTFDDKITFKLPKCFYTGTKVNDLSSERFGKDLKLNYNS